MKLKFEIYKHICFKPHRLTEEERNEKICRVLAKKFKKPLDKS